jgi:uncharacterized protein (TIGR02147 family)
MELIKKDSKGCYKPTEKTVKTGEYAQNDIIRQYQIQCLKMAEYALINKHEQPEDISTNILSISGDGLKKVQDKLRCFREEIRAIVHNDDKKADRVYQLDIQLFANMQRPG